MITSSTVYEFVLPGAAENAMVVSVLDVGLALLSVTLHDCPDG